MAKETTAIRLKRIMDERNLRQVDILEMAKPFCEMYGVKMNKSDLSQYCSGKVEPHQEKLYILGCALNVSESWLMGFDVPMERNYQYNIGDFTGDERLRDSINKNQKERVDSLDLSTEETSMVKTFRSLDNFGKDTVMAVLEKEYERCQMQNDDKVVQFAVEQEPAKLAARNKYKISREQEKRIVDILNGNE